MAGDLGVPDAVKFDSEGYIVSTQVASGQVLRIDPRSGDKTLLAQLNPGLDNLTFVGDRLFVSNFTGEITEILAGGETRTVLPGGLNWPLDLVVGDDGRLYVADGTYFYAVGADGSLETVGMLFSPGYPGFLRGLAPAGAGEFVVTTSGGQIARYRPGDGETDYLADGFDQLYGVAIGPGDSIVFAELGTGQRARAAVGQRRTARLRTAGPGRCGVRPRRGAAGGRVGRGPRRAAGRLDRDRRRRTAAAAGHPCRATVSSTSSTPAQRRSSRSTWPAVSAHTIASGLPVGPPPGVNPKPLKGMPPFSGPQGPFAGITVGPDGTSVRVGRRRRQRSGIATHMTVTPADHRYLQVARTLRKEIVDGVYPVGSQLPTEHATVRAVRGQPLHRARGAATAA